MCLSGWQILLALVAQLSLFNWATFWKESANCIIAFLFHCTCPILSFVESQVKCVFLFCWKLTYKLWHETIFKSQHGQMCTELDLPHEITLSIPLRRLRVSNVWNCWWDVDSTTLRIWHCIPRLSIKSEFYFLFSFSFALSIQLIWSWGRRAMAVAREVTRHGWAHPYSWLVTIVSLSGSRKWRNKPQKWLETKLLRHVPQYRCQHASSTCQSHFGPVQCLHEASQNYMELSCSTPLFLVLRFHKKGLQLTLRLLGVQPILPLLGHILSVPSRSFGWHGSVGWSCKSIALGSCHRCSHGQLHLQACGIWRH